jgi:aspartate aminotransferase
MKDIFAHISDELAPPSVGDWGLAAAVSQLGTEPAFSVLARAKELERAGRDVIHLEIGEPDFDTPPHIVDAAVVAMRAGETHYCPSAGIAEFRTVVARELSRSRAVQVEPERIVVGNGAKPFLFFTVLAVCNPGDEVIYPDPSFPIYESAIRWAGGTPVPLPIREDSDFTFAVEELAERLTDRTKLVILNSPHNPTGGVIHAPELAMAAELFLSTSTWVLADEVYSRILYTGTSASIASQPGMLDRTVLLDSLSKTHAMTGWRCGFAAVPEPLVEPITRFFVNSTSCVPPFIQHAGIAALTGPQDHVTEMVDELQARRELVVDGLNALPDVSCRRPQGAFYAFPNVSELPLNPEVLAHRLLEEAGVALLPGSGFGAQGDRHLRLSYANSRENLAEGLERMERFLAKLV